MHLRDKPSGSFHTGCLITYARSNFSTDIDFVWRIDHQIKALQKILTIDDEEENPKINKKYTQIALASETRSFTVALPFCFSTKYAIKFIQLNNNITAKSVTVKQAIARLLYSETR